MIKSTHVRRARYFYRLHDPINYSRSIHAKLLRPRTSRHVCQNRFSLTAPSESSKKGILRSTLTFGHREISFVISVTLRYPLPRYSPSARSLRQSHYAPPPEHHVPLALSPEGCCSRLGGDPNAIGVAPPVSQPEVSLEATRHTP